MPIHAIVEADLGAALTELKREGAASSTRNKYLQLFQSLCKWGQKRGYLTRSWFTVDPEVGRDSERDAERHRRLAPETSATAGEERRLLHVSAPRLQRLVLGALETCCRQGELLALQWQDVGVDWLQIRDTKNGLAREIPISARLRAVLELARCDPAGRPLGPQAYVFGNEFGEAAPFPRKAWQTAVLKAHGHRPQWEPGRGKLTATCQALYDRIDLHFHDLRHEGGSRLLEAGWPLHHVRDMLGHQDLATTNRYLNADRHNLRDSMRRSDEARKVCKPFANLALDPTETTLEDAEPNDRKPLVN
jgi:integrase